ncbi:RluA family pseudouridine synthase [Mariluticola halotolerans]|uniref:RluA family pseudouridine synthase n=1 Tax=Mariluticola halotolerans TaxID=2909283 RepID=UPI0026E322F9|nr:RluA family pseudouridine synthase [Mariluticola halotolerans]UJQ95258.1 RluA family pseudouridine synthase [Mariluticola halotolerans]
MAAVQQQDVSDDEDGMRLDRWFALHFPQLPFGRLQKLLRTGQVRVDKARVKANTRLAAGQVVRIPPVDDEAKPATPRINAKDVEFLRNLIIYEDDDIYVFNKPHGLAVQGGSGTKRHMDGMLQSLINKKGEAPRLVHRLDRDTSGCLLVAKTRAVASHFGQVFRTRSARKIYWALTVGVPNPPQGRISCFVARQSTKDGEQMVVVNNGDNGAQHSVSHYSVTDTAGRDFAWVTLKPVTGRTHQLRVHMQEMGTPILDDPRYFTLDNWNWERPEVLGEGLHLHARRLALPLRNGKRLDITAPLPPHMVRSFNALGFDANRYDAQDHDPED